MMFEISIVENVRELPFTYTICQFIVSEKRCFSTAERIQIITVNKRKSDLSTLI